MSPAVAEASAVPPERREASLFDRHERPRSGQRATDPPFDLASYTGPYVLVWELAVYMRSGRDTIYRAIRKGALIVIRPGDGSIRIPTPQARRFAGLPSQ